MTAMVQLAAELRKAKGKMKAQEEVIPETQAEVRLFRCSPLNTRSMQDDEGLRMAVMGNTRTIMRRGPASALLQHRRREQLMQLLHYRWTS